MAGFPTRYRPISLASTVTKLQHVKSFLQRLLPRRFHPNYHSFTTDSEHYPESSASPPQTPHGIPNTSTQGERKTKNPPPLDRIDYHECQRILRLVDQILYEYPSPVCRPPMPLLLQFPDPSPAASAEPTPFRFTFPDGVSCYISPSPIPRWQIPDEGPSDHMRLKHLRDAHAGFEEPILTTAEGPDRRDRAGGEGYWSQRDGSRDRTRGWDRGRDWDRDSVYRNMAPEAQSLWRQMLVAEDREAEREMVARRAREDAEYLRLNSEVQKVKVPVITIIPPCEDGGKAVETTVLTPSIHGSEDGESDAESEAGDVRLKRDKGKGRERQQDSVIWVQYNGLWRPRWGDGSRIRHYQDDNLPLVG